MKPFARKGGRKGGPKIQSLSVSAGAYEAVSYRIVSDDSLRRVALSQLQILIQVRTNTASEFRFFLRIFFERAREGEKEMLWIV